MMNHQLKCWPEYFQAMKSGAKSFEVRKWDRPYNMGDTLRLREYDPATMEFTGDEVERTVTYLLDMTYLPGDNIPHFAGYVVLGLADPEAAIFRVEAERLRVALEEMEGICNAEADWHDDSAGHPTTLDSMRRAVKIARAALEKEST